MKILYLACHAVLEYDELKLFEELGYDYFSLGGYINPKKPHVDTRPPLNGKEHKQLIAVSAVHSAYNLHEEQVAWADVVIIMHIPEWVENNWDLFKRLGKRVIWRSIGQSVTHIEERLTKYRLDGLEVVRYSPAEKRIPSYMGEDAMIRFYKDPDEFGNWNGNEETLITFAQDMKNRGKYCNFEAFQTVGIGLNTKLYGLNNDNAGMLSGGELSYDDMKKKMRDSRVYFYTGTHPASYTLNFIEAWMTGIPIVAIGNTLGNGVDFNQNTYEITELMTHGVHGFVSDDLSQCRIFIEQLLKDKAFATQIGRQGRQKAIDLFGKDLIKRQWKDYIEK